MAARMKASLVPDIYLTPHSTAEVLDFRCAIEVETAGLAARKATAEDIAELKRLLARQLDVENRTPKSFADDDNAFHMTIAKSTGNSLIIATYELLADIFSSAMMHTVRSLGMEIGIPYHKRLVEAIEAHDEHRAIVTMKEHMNTTRDHFLNLSLIHICTTIPWNSLRRWREKLPTTSRCVTRCVWPVVTMWI